MAEQDVKPVPAVETTSNGSDTRSNDGSLGVIEANVLQGREIGLIGAISLVVNKIVGAGIFSTPATIFKLSGSVGMALMIWVIGGLISTCGAMVMLEFGVAMPRSGGIKIYLERCFSPKFMQTCIYLFFCVFLQVSASNAITASSYLLLAGGVEETTWKLRGVAIAAATFAVGIHTVAPRVGRALQDLLGAVKLFTLLFIVCTGFAALAGHVKGTPPDNFNIKTSFKGTSDNGYNIGTALISAIFSFQGYDNVNAVLSEVKNPQKTLRIALPTAMGVITVLYLLANVAYFAAVSREEFLDSDITIAATLFRNVFGESAGTRVLPALVAISAVGHLLGIAYTVPRVIQELAKDGIMPFPDILMENRPFRTPSAALALHLGVSILFICAPPAGDAFNFIVSLSSYPMTFLLTCITIGLIKMRLSKKEAWTSGFTAPWIIIALYMAGNIFLLVMPFVRPPGGKGNTNLPYWLSPVVALSILSLGVIYYTVRFVALPWAFGYRLDAVAVELSDGSAVTRYRARGRKEKVYT